jgi:hypothetical protein
MNLPQFPLHVCPLASLPRHSTTWWFWYWAAGLQNHKPDKLLLSIINPVYTILLRESRPAGLPRLIYDPSDSGGRDQEDRGLKPAQANSSRDHLMWKPRTNNTCFLQVRMPRQRVLTVLRRATWLVSGWAGPHIPVSLKSPVY